MKVNENRAFTIPSPLNGKPQYIVVYEGSAYDSRRLAKVRNIKQDTATGWLRAAYEKRRTIESLFTKRTRKQPPSKHAKPMPMKIKDVWVEEERHRVDDETTWRDILILAFCKSRGAV